MRGRLRKCERRRNALQVTLHFHLHAGEVEVRTVSKIHLRHARACEEGGGGEHHQNGLRLVLRAREEEAVACPNVFSKLVVGKEGRYSEGNRLSSLRTSRVSHTMPLPSCFLPTPNPQALPKSIDIDFG